MIRPPVEDELAIRELYARYSWALDTGDTDGYVALFAPDAEATEETATGELEVRKGRDEIRKLVLKFHQRPTFPATSTRWTSCCSSPIQGVAATTGRSAATPGRQSTARRPSLSSIGAATCATWSARSTANG